MILVTGGTGLVGSHLLFNLVKKKENVRAIYRTEETLEKVKLVFSYYSDTADVLFSKIEWVKATLTNIPQLQDAFKGITHVYHCAAFISFTPNTYHILRKTNIEGTANIVNLCVSNAVEKLCYVSSIAAIGNSKKQLITEDTEYNPEAENSVYAITKYGAELEVWRGSQEGLDVVIINPGVILGAGFWYSGSGTLFKRIYNGMKYYVNGTTGYVDVCDVVSIMQLLMESTIKNENYILVSENLSFKDFQEQTANALGVKPAKKEAKPWLLNIAWRLDWLRHKILRRKRRFSKQMAKSVLKTNAYDNSKICNALDYNFKSISTSIKTISELLIKDSA